MHLVTFNVWIDNIFTLRKLLFLDCEVNTGPQLARGGSMLVHLLTKENSLIQLATLEASTFEFGAFLYFSRLHDQGNA